jgi:hypothetical protein
VVLKFTVFQLLPKGLTQDIGVDWAMHLVRNWKVLDSNLDQNNEYPDGGFYGVAQSLQADTKIVPQNSPRPLLY